MSLLPKGLRSAATIAFCACLSCGAPRPGVPARAASSTAATHRSSRFGFSWTLPRDWEFVPIERFYKGRPQSVHEMVAAARRGLDRPVLIVMVTSVIWVAPGHEWGRKESDFVDATSDARATVESSGLRFVAARRVHMLGQQAVEVTGERGLTRLSVRIFRHEHRQFAFRCMSYLGDSEFPCERALASFRIEARPEEPDHPRVLHLRDARFGLAFDAPDDGWLAIGPRTGGGGAQVVWVWNNRGRQIDVQALDLSAASNPPDEHTFVTRLAESWRAKGTRVSVARSTLAGLPCHRLELDFADGSRQDLFTLMRGDTNYSLLVTAPTRDPVLIEQARHGFRLLSN